MPGQNRPEIFCRAAPVTSVTSTSKLQRNPSLSGAQSSFLKVRTSKRSIPASRIRATATRPLGLAQKLEGVVDLHLQALLERNAHGTLSRLVED